LGILKVMHSNVTVTYNLSSEGTPVDDLPSRTISFQIAFFLLLFAFTSWIYRWKAVVAGLWYCFTMLAYSV